MSIANDRVRSGQLLARSSFAAFLAGLIVTGCVPSGPTVVGRWEEPAGQDKINPVETLGEPQLKSVDLSSDPGYALVYLTQRKSTMFSSRKKYAQYQVIRTTHQLDAVPPGIRYEGNTQVIDVGTVLSEAQRQGAEEAYAVKSIKSGAAQVAGHRHDYRKESVGERVEPAGEAQEEGGVTAAEVDVELRGVSDPKISSRTKTDSVGRARVQLARNLADAESLRPGLVQVAAVWRGRSIVLGSFDLTPLAIAQCQEFLNRENTIAIGKPDLPPFARVTFTSSSNEVSAGSEVEFSVTVSNVGKGDFYRLVATSDCDFEPFRGLTWTFGKLAAGATRTVKQRAVIPRWQPARQVRVNLRWSEANNYQPDLQYASLIVRALPRPDFAVMWHVKDDGSGRSVGNGDGRIQRGEAFDILVTVRNIGQGRAQDVWVELEGINGEGVTLHTPKGNLGTLDIGERNQKSVRLTVSMTKLAKIVRLDGNFVVADKAMNVRLVIPLSLTLDAPLPAAVLSYRAVLKTGPTDVSVRIAADDSSRVIGRLKPATNIRATGEMGDWVRVEAPEMGTGWVRQAAFSRGGHRPDTRPAALDF